MNAEKMVHGSVAAVNRGDPLGYAAFYAVDGVTHDPLSAEPCKGRDAIAHEIAMSIQAFPDMHGTVQSVITDGNEVAAEVLFTGTHDGPLETPAGELPPTGRRISFQLCSRITLGPDGRAVETRRYYDVYGILTQLGLTS